MTTSQEPHHRNSTNSHSIARSALPYRWEIGFFLCAYTLLVIQVLLFYYDINSLANGRVAVAVYAAVESFVVKRLTYLTLPAIYIPLVCLLFCARPPSVDTPVFRYCRWLYYLQDGYTVNRPEYIAF